MQRVKQRSAQHPLDLTAVSPKNQLRKGAPECNHEGRAQLAWRGGAEAPARDDAMQQRAVKHGQPAHVSKQQLVSMSASTAQASRRNDAMQQRAVKHGHPAPCATKADRKFKNSLNEYVLNEPVEAKVPACIGARQKRPTYGLQSGCGLFDG